VAFFPGAVRTMAQQSDPIRERFIHEAGEFANGLGLSRSVGQLYALLYMSPEPVCLDEMAEACQMSKGNASMNVRELERWGAAQRVWVRGDRKDYYEPNRDIAGIVIARCQDGLGRRLGFLEGVVEDAAGSVEQMESPDGNRDFYAERLREVRKLIGSARKALNNLDKMYAVARRFL